MAKREYKVGPDWKMFLPEEPAHESDGSRRKGSILGQIDAPFLKAELGRWAKGFAKMELQADPEMMAKRTEALDALREKYAAEDAAIPGPRTPAENAARAREWANARSEFNPYPLKDPKGIEGYFSLPTRGTYPETVGDIYKPGKKNLITTTVDCRVHFQDSADGIHIYGDNAAITAAMQIAQQRWDGGFGVQGGSERFRQTVAAKAIILDIPLKGLDMERRVSEIRAMIEKEKDIILAKEGRQPTRAVLEPERQPEPELTPEVQRAMESTPEIPSKQSMDDILKGLTVEGSTIVRQFRGNAEGREDDGWPQDSQAIIEITLRDQESREVHLLYDTMHGDFQATDKTSESLGRGLQAAFEASEEWDVFGTAANMVGQKLGLDDMAQNQLDAVLHEKHLADIAAQLQGGTPTPDPEVPGHVGRNAQGDNVCVISDENGKIKAWGVYADNGVPHISQGKEGWKKALDGMVDEAMRARASASTSKETPERETPSQERNDDDRDM